MSMFAISSSLAVACAMICAQRCGRAARRNVAAASGSPSTSTTFDGANGTYRSSTEPLPAPMWTIAATGETVDASLIDAVGKSLGAVDVEAHA